MRQIVQLDLTSDLIDKADCSSFSKFLCTSSTYLAINDVVSSALSIVTLAISKSRLHTSILLLVSQWISTETTKLPIYHISSINIYRLSDNLLYLVPEDLRQVLGLLRAVCRGCSVCVSLHVLPESHGLSPPVRHVFQRLLHELQHRPHLLLHPFLDNATCLCLSHALSRLRERHHIQTEIKVVCELLAILGVSKVCEEPLLVDEGARSLAASQFAVVFRDQESLELLVIEVGVISGGKHFIDKGLYITWCLLKEQLNIVTLLAGGNKSLLEFSEIFKFFSE